MLLSWINILSIVFRKSRDQLLVNIQLADFHLARVLVGQLFNHGGNLLGTERHPLQHVGVADEAVVLLGRALRLQESSAQPAL